MFNNNCLKREIKRSYRENGGDGDGSIHEDCAERQQWRFKMSALWKCVGLSPMCVFILLDIDVYRAKVLRLVSSLLLVSSTLSQKMFSQAYSFSNFMPFRISVVFFRRSVECS